MAQWRTQYFFQIPLATLHRPFRCLISHRVVAKFDSSMWWIHFLNSNNCIVSIWVRRPFWNCVTLTRGWYQCFGSHGCRITCDGIQISFVPRMLESRIVVWYYHLVAPLPMNHSCCNVNHTCPIFSGGDDYEIAKYVTVAGGESKVRNHVYIYYNIAIAILCTGIFKIVRGTSVHQSIIGGGGVVLPLSRIVKHSQ